MFQYAAARACSPDEQVTVDLSFMESNSASTDAFTSRKYRLSAFKHIKVGTLKYFQKKILFNQHFGYRLLKKIIFPGFKTIGDHNPSLINTHILKTNQSAYLDGYFQNENYFKHIRPLLLHEFSFPELGGKSALMRDKIKSGKISVAIHVRRGDYLKPQANAYHGILPLSYYTEAMAIINKSINDAHYFIFSDDMPWCRGNFASLENDVTFADSGGEDWSDMALMSICHHQIIANSSFSWWAAWLNPAENKIVIAPKKWFADSNAMKQASDIVPNNWIKI